MHRHPARVVEAARLLLLGPKQLAAAAKAWAAEAATDPRQGSLFGKPPTPDQAWATFLKVGGVQAQAPAVDGTTAPPPTSGPVDTREWWRLIEANRLEVRKAIEPGNQGMPRPAQTALRAYEASHPAETEAGRDEMAAREEAEMGGKLRRGFAKEEAQIASLGAAPKPPDAFAQAVLAAANKAPVEARWGANRVFLRAVYDALPLPRPEWPEWSRQMIEASGRGVVRMVGGEQTGAMPAELYRASEVTGPGGSRYRFLVVDGGLASG